MTDSQHMDAQDMISTVVAYHAAGRAAVAAALGQDVHGISVHDGGDCVSHRPPGDDERDPDTELVILVAGPCAERKLAALVSGALETWPGDSDAEIWLDTIRDLESGALVYQPDADGRWPDNDSLALAWTLGGVPDCERRRKLDDGRRGAEEILGREWSDVEAIAGCLGARLSRQPS